MSFSSTVKDELVGIKTQSREERLSILCGLTHTAAAVTLGRGGLGIEYVSESENVAELARALTAELYGLNASFSTRKQEGLKRSSIIVHASGEGCRQLLIDCGSLAKYQKAWPKATSACAACCAAHSLAAAP